MSSLVEAIPEGLDLLVEISRLLLASSDILGGPFAAGVQRMTFVAFEARETIKAKGFCDELWISLIRDIDIITSTGFMDIQNSIYEYL